MSKVRPGDPLRIDARTWNRVVDVTSAQHTQLGPTLPDMERIVLRVRNMTGEPRARYDAVRIAGPVIGRTDDDAEFFRRPLLSALPPALDERIGVMADATDDTLVGRAIVCGATYARVQVGHEHHRYAEPLADEYMLATAGGGWPLLWVEPEPERETEGVAWALVLLGAREYPIVPVQVLGYTDSDRVFRAKFFSLSDGEAYGAEFDLHAASLPFGEQPQFGHVVLDEMCDPQYLSEDVIRAQWQSHWLRGGRVTGMFAVDTFRFKCIEGA